MQELKFVIIHLLTYGVYKKIIVFKMTLIRSLLPNSFYSIDEYFNSNIYIPDCIVLIV